MVKSDSISVTGLGVISAIGINKEENRENLKAAVSGIRFQSSIDSKYAQTLPFGEVSLSTGSLKEILGIESESVTRTSLLALHALKEALADSNLGAGDIKSPRTALIVGNTVGGMCLTRELYRDANLLVDSSPYVTSYDCGSVTLFLRDHFDIGGWCDTINTACSSSANAILMGARLIRHGLADRAIVGGADSLSVFTINGFNALNILSDNLCRPFDRDRKGLNLGEGAGFLVMERTDEHFSGKRYGMITGFGNHSDAFHPSSISPEGDGPFLAMETALRMAGIKPGDIDFINTHGTGTENNDETESRAMQRLFGNVPPFSASKSRIGHTLGAAGAVESVFTLMSLYHGEIHPSVNFENPIPETGLSPNRSSEKRTLRHVMSNSFGFGGNCTSLVFSAFKQ